MTTYLLRPKPGKSEAEIDRQPRPDNCWIAEYEGDKLIDLYDAIPELVAALDPIRPAEWTEREKLVTERGVEAVWEPLPEGRLARGSNPYHQLIYRAVQTAGEATDEDIVRALIQVYKVAPATDFYMKEIEHMVSQMHARGLLQARRGKWTIGLKMEYGTFVKFHPGYDPREKAIEQYVQGKGGASYGEIHSYLCDYLGWVEEPKIVENLLAELCQLGVLQESPEGWFSCVKSLEPYQG